MGAMIVRTIGRRLRARFAILIALVLVVTGCGDIPLLSTIEKVVEIYQQGYFVYWTDGNSIRRATADGSQVQTFLSNLAGLNAIFVDAASNTIYWSEMSSGSIKRADLDSGAVQPVVTGLSNPQGVAVGGGWLYWTDIAAFNIQRVSLSGGPRQELIPGIDARDVALDVPGGKMYWTTVGGTIRRADLDGTSQSDLVPGVGAVRIALDVSGGKIYWAQMGGDAGRANLSDGSGVEWVLTDPSYLNGIALDLANDRIYWTDMGATLKVRSRAIAGGPVTDIAPAVGTIMDIAVRR